MKMDPDPLASDETITLASFSAAGDTNLIFGHYGVSTTVQPQ